MISRFGSLATPTETPKRANERAIMSGCNGGQVSAGCRTVGQSR